jgi:hypothetical protein
MFSVQEWDRTTRHPHRGVEWDRQLMSVTLPYRQSWTACEIYLNWYVDVECVRKVAVHLQNVLEVMSTSVYTGLNPFNFIRKHFLQIC